MIIEINTLKNYYNVRSRGPMLIDFYTEWCGPCKIQSEILEENENQLQDKFPKLQIVKLNCDKIGDITDQFNIMAIPTLVLLNADGTEHKMESGVKSIDKITDYLNNNLNSERK